MVLNASYVCLHAFSLHREPPDPDPGRETPHLGGGSVTIYHLSSKNLAQNSILETNGK
jgi:hypothetical protein